MNQFQDFQQQEACSLWQRNSPQVVTQHIFDLKPQKQLVHYKEGVYCHFWQYYASIPPLNFHKFLGFFTDKIYEFSLLDDCEVPWLVIMCSWGMYPCFQQLFPVLHHLFVQEDNF